MQSQMQAPLSRLFEAASPREAGLTGSGHRPPTSARTMCRRRRTACGDVPVFPVHSLGRRVVIIDLCAQGQTLLESFYGQGTGAITHHWKRTYSTLGIVYQKERRIKPRHRALLRIAAAALRCGFAGPTQSPRSAPCGPARDHSPRHKNARAGAVLPRTVNARRCVWTADIPAERVGSVRTPGKAPTGALAAVAVICARLQA